MFSLEARGRSWRGGAGALSEQRSDEMWPVMRGPALPLGERVQANKTSLWPDNLGSTSLAYGYVTEEYGLGQKKAHFFVPDMTRTTASSVPWARGHFTHLDGW